MAVNKAARDIAALNVSFTKVRAPSAGRISRRSIDPGNLVKADDTSVTSIALARSGMYGYFDLTSAPCCRLKRLIREGKSSGRSKRASVLMGLADERDFPARGHHLAENRVDPDTGTWPARPVRQSRQRLDSRTIQRMRLPIGVRIEPS